MPKLMDYLQTDSKLSTMTGIESFEVLDQIIDLVQWAHGPYAEPCDNDITHIPYGNLWERSKPHI